MTVARVARFDVPPSIRADDRRARSLHAPLRSHGFRAAYHLREPAGGRLMSLNLWESVKALAVAEHPVHQRPESERGGIVPSRVERWLDDARF